MKKYIFYILILCSIISYSQKRSNYIISGNLNFNSTSFNDDDIDIEDDVNFFSSIKVGHISKNSNLEIGFGLAYSKLNRNNFSSFSDDDFETITGLIYARQYFPLTDKFAFSLSGEFGYSKSYYENRDDFDQKTYTLEFKTGLIYFVTKRIGLTADFGSIGYNSSKFREISGDSSINNIFFNFDPSDISLGLAFLF